MAALVGDDQVWDNACNRTPGYFEVQRATWRADRGFRPGMCGLAGRCAARSEAAVRKTDPISEFTRPLSDPQRFMPVVRSVG
jgi:hypothetical protein